MTTKNKETLVVLCMGVSGEADNSENRYEHFLIDNGYKCDVLQVLQFEFVNLDELQNRLSRSDSYSGLVLTSPRAVAALAASKAKNPLCVKSWLEKSTFCIGHATETTAKEDVGLLNILGSESGNAKNLADYIITKMDKTQKPLLLPCSDIARDTIPKILTKEEIGIEKIVVYKTKAHESLKETFASKLAKHPDVLVFYSPSIVEHLVSVKDNDIRAFENFKNIAIGPVTEQAMLNFGIKVDGVLEKPEPLALIQVLEKIC
ncbi:unnamed protein product [Trichogramma brassicae]|uniref:Uroporphyrinogen-III synthase n=1 Tax=Trichogramma brassicae TaxID=86971 RepID=A0A6H5J1Y3_9HYME|nr:unnamed protein product [Trichogramma brassicae]